MTYNKVPKWGENPQERLPMMQEDGVTEQKQDIARQYFTQESYLKMLFHALIKQDIKLPEYISFNNAKNIFAQNAFVYI